MILSTCNRVEIYAAARNADQAIVDLKDFLSHYHRLPVKSSIKTFIRTRRKRLSGMFFGVASSLDSMVVGEPQILGQMKTRMKSRRRQRHRAHASPAPPPCVSCGETGQDRDEDQQQRQYPSAP